MLKVNNSNTRTRCEICLKLTRKTHFTPSSVAIDLKGYEMIEDINFEDH